MTEVDIWEENVIRTVLLALPYLEVVEVLISVFKPSEDQKRVFIANTLCDVVIHHFTSSGAKRAQDVFEAWIANKNDLVRFYSAKGLWERDRGQAARVLKDLSLNGSPEVQRLVGNLAAIWNIS